MFDSDSTMHRRGFLGSLAAGAATLGLASIPGAERMMAAPAAMGAGAGEFESQLKKLSSRKHKQVFDGPKPNESLPVIWSWAFLFSNNQLGIDDNDIGALVVFRHEAIPFAMEDRLWDKYKFGEVFHIEDKMTKAPSVRNVVTHIKPGDMPLPDMALEKCQQRGVLFGVCDLALTVYSSHIAEASGMNPEEVKKDWVSGLLPGIVTLPSGVWAVNRAQEAGFTYCFAG
jgi:hypothetical protein